MFLNHYPLPEVTIILGDTAKKKGGGGGGGGGEEILGLWVVC